MKILLETFDSKLTDDEFCYAGNKNFATVLTSKRAVSLPWNRHDYMFTELLEVQDSCGNISYKTCPGCFV